MSRKRVAFEGYFIMKAAILFSNSQIGLFDLRVLQQVPACVRRYYLARLHYIPPVRGGERDLGILFDKQDSRALTVNFLYRDKNFLHDERREP